MLSTDRTPPRRRRASSSYDDDWWLACAWVAGLTAVGVLLFATKESVATGWACATAIFCVAAALGRGAGRAGHVAVRAVWWCLVRSSTGLAYLPLRLCTGVAQSALNVWRGNVRICALGLALVRDRYRSAALALRAVATRAATTARLHAQMATILVYLLGRRLRRRAARAARSPPRTVTDVAPTPDADARSRPTEHQQEQQPAAEQPAPVTARPLDVNAPRPPAAALPGVPAESSPLRRRAAALPLPPAPSGRRPQAATAVLTRPSTQPLDSGSAPPDVGSAPEEQGSSQSDAAQPGPVPPRAPASPPRLSRRPLPACPTVPGRVAAHPATAPAAMAIRHPVAATPGATLPSAPAAWLPDVYRQRRAWWQVHTPQGQATSASPTPLPALQQSNGQSRGDNGPAQRRVVTNKAPARVDPTTVAGLRPHTFDASSRPTPRPDTAASDSRTFTELMEPAATAVPSGSVLAVLLEACSQDEAPSGANAAAAAAPDRSTNAAADAAAQSSQNTQAAADGEAAAAEAAASDAAKQGDTGLMAFRSKRKSRAGEWRIGTANVRGKSSTGELSNMVRKHQLDVVCLTEVGMKQDVCFVNFDVRTLWKRFPGETDTVPFARGVGWAVREGVGAPRILKVEWFGPRVSVLTTRWRSTTVSFVGFYGPADDRANLGDFQTQLETGMAAAKGQLVLLGDSNAHLGFKHGDKIPTPSRWFSEFLEQEELVVSNYDTVMAKRKRTTFTTCRLAGTNMRRAPRVLDVIIVPQRYRDSMRATRAVNMHLDGADHKLVRARFRPVWRRNKSAVAERPESKAVEGTVGDAWKKLEEAYRAVETVKATRPRVAWATEEVRRAIDAKADAYKTWQDHRSPDTRQAYMRTRRKAQRELRAASRRYWEEWAKQVEADVNEGHISSAFKRLRPKYKASPVHFPTDDTDGCRAHFESLLGPRELPAIDESKWDTLPHAPRRDILDTEPTVAEVEKALRQLSDNAPGPDKMRAGSLKLVPKDVTLLVQEIWRTGRVPPAFQEALLVALPKKPGATAWTDHRGITLLCVPSKVLARVMLNRFADVELLGQQCGFRKGSSTADAVVALKHIIDEGRRCGVGLVFTFVDLAKAYDTIPRRLVWDTLRRIGTGERMIGLLQQLYDDRIYVRVGSTVSTKAFKSTQGVRQGCLLSPFLFNLVFDRVLRALDPTMPGVKVGEKREKFRAFADDLALISGTRQQAQRDIDEMQKVFDVAGLTLSTGKTCVMQLHHNPPPETVNPENVPGVKCTPDGHLYVVPKKAHGKFQCPITGCTTLCAKKEGITHHVHDVHGITPTVLQKEPIYARVKAMVWSTDATTGSKTVSCGVCGFTKARSTVDSHCATKNHYVYRWVRTDKKPIETGGDGTARVARATERRDAWKEIGVLPDGPEPEHLTARDTSGDRVRLQNVSEFKYLGRMLSASGSDVGAATARLREAAGAAHAIFRQGQLKHASSRTRLHVFRAIVHAKVVYCAETWCLNTETKQKLDTFQQRWLRRLTGVLPKKVGGTLKFPARSEVLKAADTYSLSDQVDVQRLRFFGHTLRHPAAVRGELALSGRAGFGVSNTLQGQLRELAAEAGLVNSADRSPLVTLQTKSQNRTQWNAAVRKLQRLRQPKTR